MDIILDIIDRISDDSIIILTIIFEERYNVSIGKDYNYTTLYFYDSDTSITQKIKYVNKKRKNIENFLNDNIDNIPIHHINGISSTQNKEYLSKYFIITDYESDDELINISKKFI